MVFGEEIMKPEGIVEVDRVKEYLQPEDGRQEVVSQGLQIAGEVIQ